MNSDTKTRFRVNAKQSTKNIWTIDATAENESDKLVRSLSKEDAADVITEPLGLRLLSLIKETEKAFREDGRKMAGDE